MTIETVTKSIFAKSVAAVGALLISGSALAIDIGGGSGAASAYERSGPHATTSGREGLSCVVHRPRNVEDDTPVIIWGNGTGATPTTYAGGLEHWASWGFVVAAAQTSNAGSGDEMIDCLDQLRRASYASSLDFSNVGASGHSQGGGGTIMAASKDSRIKATAPIQPYVIGLGHRASSQRDQTVPMLLISGSADTVAIPGVHQSQVFRNVPSPVFWATVQGAGHFEPLGSFGDFRGMTTAWWMYQLKGDAEAGQLFTGSCGLCNERGVDVDTKNF